MEGCGWWADTDTFNEAEIALRRHVAVHLGVVWEPRRAEVQRGRRA